MYEVTGGQKTAAIDLDLDFTGLARAAGFPTASNFEDLEHWTSTSESFFAKPGPRFARLAVGPTGMDLSIDSLPPIDERCRLLRQALCDSES
jgi:hypothetical protein